MDNERSALRWGVEQRLGFIEFRLFWEGHVNRSDLMEQFGVSVNQASTDLNRYIGFAPDNIVYDKSARTYVRGPAFKPRFLEPDASREMFRKIIRSFSKRKPQVPFKRWKITRGDMVQVICGNNKGKIGEVLKVFRRKNQVLVDGVNIKMKRSRGDDEGESIGGARPILHPVHVSTVNLLDPVTGTGTRVAIGYLEDGTKVRVSKRSGSIIEKPKREEERYENRHKDKVDGEKDTPPDRVLEVTYKGEDFSLIRDEFLAEIEEKERVEKLLVFEN